MDQEVLVGNRLEDGKRLIAQLTKDGFEVAVAFWIQSSDEWVRHLYIGSPLVLDEKPGEAFLPLYASLSRLQDSSISYSDLRPINSDNPVARHALLLRDRYGEQGKVIRVQGFRVGNFFSEEAVIYPRTGDEDRRGAHRDLIGIESPPLDHEPDLMTLGPKLPPGWDGDAWMRLSPEGNSYWLRAWNKQTGQFAIAQASRYDEAAQFLRARIDRGETGRVEVAVTHRS